MKIRQIKTAQAGAMTAGIGLALMKVVLGILAGIGLSIEGIKLALPIIKRKLAERKAEKEGKLTEDDVHDALMKEVFGIREYTFMGKTHQGRYSLSDAGGLKTSQVMDLIEKDLATCSFLGIVVPTLESLGYISNNKPYCER